MNNEQANNQTENKVVTASKFAIVNFIATAFNLGDYGKVENFVSKTVDMFNKEIKAAKRNIVNAEHNAENTMLELNEKLEDVQNELQEAFTSIELDKIQTNAAQAEYREVWLSNISRAEKVVAKVEKEIEVQKLATDKLIEEYRAEIKVRENRIETISK